MYKKESLNFLFDHRFDFAKLYKKDSNGNLVVQSNLTAGRFTDIKGAYYETVDENGNTVVGVSSYNPTENGFDELEPVEDENEWAMLEEVFQSFIEECDGCEESDCCNCPHQE